MRSSRTGPYAIACFVWIAMLAACSGEAPLPGDPLRLATGSLGDPVLGEAYRGEIAAAGGLRPYTFQLDAGTLPPGLRLQGGVLVGTPTELGRYEFTVAVSDANLARNLRSYVVTVRDVPVPTLTLAVPETEVRDEVVLRGRIEDARALRAIRLRLQWEDGTSVRLDDDAVRSRRSDVALFWEARENGVAIDLAILGEAWTGSGELFSITLTADEATRLSVASEAELLYADRHAYRTARFGAPPADAAEGAQADEDEPDASPDEDPADGSDETPA
ncbi:MAG: Ig domain-containing protein, partial [Trueperaceae bacterium]